MKHGSLFSGIGGFDLAAQWMGWENVFHCEIEDFPRKILNYYWPNAISYEDIKRTNFNIHRGRIDILTGGFPCQPYSQAGKRLGKEDDRHLWPEMLRAIREIQPRWVVGENVYGLVNWNDGLVFDEVQTDLENEGYSVQSYILPACSVDAPHRRDRLWIVAHANNDGGPENTERDKKGSALGEQHESLHLHETITNSDSSTKGKQGKDAENEGKGLTIAKQGRGSGNTSVFTNGLDDVPRTTPNANNKRQKQQSGNTKPRKQRQFSGTFEEIRFKQRPTQSPICGGNDGFSSKLDNITFPKWRGESIKGYGNAIVPQVVLQIFKAIEEYEKNI